MKPSREVLNVRECPFFLGVISDEVSQIYSQVLAFAKKEELDGIEIRSVGGKAFKDLSNLDIDEIAQATRDAGLRIPAVATPVFKCPVDDSAEIGRHLDIFKRSVDHAHRLGADIVRVFAFLRKEEPSQPDQLRRAADRFQPLVAAAKGAGIQIGLENEATTLVCTGSEVRLFF